MGYDNTNKGVLFKNKNKKTDNHPDYNGSIDFNGEERWLNAWVKESKEGVKYFSLSIGDLKEPKDSPPPIANSEEEEPLIEEDLPF